MKKCDIYRSERAKGKTYQLIADNYGVSRQAVCAACHTKPFKGVNCVFPSVEKWMESNYRTCADLNRLMTAEGSVHSYSSLRNFLNGKTSRADITFVNALLRVTGFTYEELMGGSKYEKRNNN